MKLKAALQQQSDWIKNMIAGSLDYEIPIWEEALTSMNLITIAQNVTLIKTTFPAEQTSGADWLWEIETDKPAQPLRLLIQAKMLDVKTMTYTSLDHRIGFGGPYQADILIDYAGTIGALPYYVFYNFVKNTPFESGCFITEARKVAAVMYKGNKSWASIQANAEPEPWEILAKFAKSDM